MSQSTSRSPHVDQGALARAAATGVGAVFLVVGVLGFVPGITTDYDQLGAAGHGSGAMLLGVFQVSVLHNLVHLAFGVVGLAAGRRTRAALAYLVVGGVVYLVLWAYGLAIDKTGAANFVPLNTADDWLHLGLGVGMIGLGLLARSAMHGTGTRGSTGHGHTTDPADPTTGGTGGAGGPTGTRRAGGLQG